MYDIKLFAKDEKVLETDTDNKNIHSMKCCTGKFSILKMKSGKRYITEGMLIEKGTYKYLRILENDTIKQVDMK